MVELWIYCVDLRLAIHFMFFCLFFNVSTIATAVWLKLRQMFSNRLYKHTGNLVVNWEVTLILLFSDPRSTRRTWCARCYRTRSMCFAPSVARPLIWANPQSRRSPPPPLPLLHDPRWWTSLGLARFRPDDIICDCSRTCPALLAKTNTNTHTHTSEDCFRTIFGIVKSPGWIFRPRAAVFMRMYQLFCRHASKCPAESS